MTASVAANNVAELRAGLSSGITSFQGRTTSAATLSSDDVKGAMVAGLNAGSVLVDYSANTTTSDSFGFRRTVAYTGGTVGHNGSALFATTVVPAGTIQNEWGLIATVSNTATAGQIGGAYLQGNKLSTGYTWGALVEACDLTNVNTSAGYGSLVGQEIAMLCNGTDNSKNRVGLDVTVGNAQFVRNGVSGILRGEACFGVRVGSRNSDTAKGIFYNAFQVNDAANAGLSNKATSTFGIFHEGTYAVGIDLAQSTNTTSAIRVKGGDNIAMDATSTFKFKYNPSNGFLEFYNGSTRHGYIDITAGADSNFNAGGGGGGAVSSFNTRTGAITLTSSDVTTALGFTPASTTGAQTLAGDKTFSGVVYATGGIVANAILANQGISIAGSYTVGWASSGNFFGSAGSLAGYVRVQVDGTNFKLPLYNT